MRVHRIRRRTPAACTERPRRGFGLGLFFAWLLGLLHLVSPTFAQDTSPAPHAHWRQLAFDDLAAAQKIIQESHPGILETQDAAFSQWMQLGAQEARALVKRAQTPAEGLAALRYYIAGFEDGHLGIMSTAPSVASPRWAGWTVERRAGEFRVVERAPAWPTELPPLGSRLIACDEREVHAFVTQRIAPFVDRRTRLEHTLSMLGALLSNDVESVPLWHDSRPVSCMFEVPGGRPQSFALNWQVREVAQGLPSYSVPVQGLRPWGPGRYWVHVTNFMRGPEDVEGYERLLAQLRQLSTADAVVLDTRGNNGGNSMDGMRILSALLKDRMPAVSTAARAYWRVSPFAVASVEWRLQRALQLDGKDSPMHRLVAGLLHDMRAALARRQPFVEQASVDDVTDARDTGPAFSGRLVLVTDSRCASACLDFVDLALKVPNILHAGLPTSGDTPYIDIGQATLPSGLTLWVPLKVWRHRERASNEAHVPQWLYQSDIRDTEAGQRWVAEQVLPWAQPISSE